MVWPFWRAIPGFRAAFSLRAGVAGPALMQGNEPAAVTAERGCQSVMCESAQQIVGFAVAWESEKRERESTMWYRQFFIAVACLAAAVIPATAQTLTGPGFFGFYDPATGAFQPVTPHSVAPAAGAQSIVAVTRGGTFVFKITIKIISAVSVIPASTKPSCTAYAYHSGNLYFSENASKTASRTGDTATCILRIPYLWVDADPSEGVSPQISVYTGSRSLSHNLASIALPDNGASRSGSALRPGPRIALIDA
jgi:hypothetical protein